ncbi:MAG: hypothetical protein KF718_17815 [Polyangiaceae bacterium]|nr:hypothetical protein [Polyangiaceae bacterium]
MTRAARLVLLASLVLLHACGADPREDRGPSSLTDLSVSGAYPSTLLPGSRLVVTGTFGDVTVPFVELLGSFDGQPVKLLLPAQLTPEGRVELDWKGGVGAGLPANDGAFTGTLRVLATGPIDGRTHLSLPRDVTFAVATSIEPKLFGVYEGNVFVNDWITVEGNNLLLGGGEGRTVAILEGCFQKQGQTGCTPIPDVEIPMRQRSEFSREQAEFAFAPKIAGIEKGSFTGTVRLRNDITQSGPTLETKQIPVDMELLTPVIFSFSPESASLGQYVNIDGGGFVGPDPLVVDDTTQVSTVRLEGTFSPTGAPSGSSVSLDLILEYVEGQRARYVLNEQDALGQLVDLRAVTGQFTGSATPIHTYGTTTVTGVPTNVKLGIVPVKQVVEVTFLPSFVESLRHFGLRAVDKRIRDRVLEVLRRDYQGVNAEFRLEKPTDFALFALVEVGGGDPNGYGLLGYDNTPGKDKGNLRLADRIGGVNAKTIQETGQPGYGGVFVESLFGFSEHPGKLADKLEVATPLFDQIFDPFRPDRGGSPVRAEDLADLNIPVLSESSRCPAKNRADRIACAVWVLGSLVGTTTSHEVAHSLGLADPEGEAFHNPGDLPNRLMDGGAARTFAERAELEGKGPAVFCDDEYLYLQAILPTNQPDPLPVRPSCY